MRTIPISLVLKACLAVGFLIGYCPIVHGQDQKLADSLELVYATGKFEKEERLDILKNLAFNHSNPDKSLEYSEELLQSALKLKADEFIVNAYQQRGNAHISKGDVSQALESYFKGVQIAMDEGYNKALGDLYMSIASAYSIMGNRKNTILYYENSIAILKEEKDSLSYAAALENLGDEYNLNFNKPDSALIFFKQSGAIFSALKNKPGMAYNLGNIGLAYALKGENDKAEKNITEAIEMLTALGDYYPIAVYLTYMSGIYAEKNDLKTAFIYANRSLGLAQQYGLKNQISDANLKLSELYEKDGDITASLRYYKEHIAYKDSVKNIASVQQMANLRTDFEIAQKEIEIDLEKQKTKTQQIITIGTTIALVLIGLLALGLYRRNNFIKRTNRIIAKEKDRSDQLLLNILPAETAIELKENGRVKAKKFESVTVLFTDFQGFTKYSENLSPEELVKSVDFYFSKFDAIIEKYGLEKIKTIGDAYMCAGGLPFPTENHAQKMVQAAFDIKDFVNDLPKENQELGVRFDIRIGINTGPVVAGVVGTKKFAYDIWGDTVNVASRMETLSEPGKINISENTYELISSLYTCEHRGEVYVKNKGMMKMYYVNHKIDGTP